MASTSTPTPKTNRIGLSVLDYKGGKTTLCAGCGHNAISERILEAMYEMGVQPERVAKLSGIGCSSKSPAYFMNRSHSFNAVHGRMPSVATGAVLANRNLLALGVSGARGEGPVTLREAFPAGYQYHVTTRVELSGSLTPTAGQGFKRGE